MNDIIIEKISNFLDREFSNKIGNIAIFKNEDGTYDIFNKFCIEKIPYGFKITFKYTAEEKTFSTLKNAVTWCIFENRNKIDRTQRIEFLDQMISSMDTQIQHYKKLIKKSKDVEIKLIYSAKLSNDQTKRKIYISELTGYINESMRWQRQKFASK